MGRVAEQVHTFGEVLGALQNKDKSSLTKYKEEKEGLQESCKNHKKMNRILQERLLQMENEIEDKSSAMVCVLEDSFRRFKNPHIQRESPCPKSASEVFHCNMLYIAGGHAR